jgi:hypothetical protein
MFYTLAAEGRIVAGPKSLPFNHNIAKKVKEDAKNGVPVDATFAAIQKYQDAPGSLTTYYKIYRHVMEEARSEAIGAVGNKVLNAALNGDEDSGTTFKYRELYLRTQGNWSPKETVQTREVGTDAEEEESAVHALMKALGKEVDED